MMSLINYIQVIYLRPLSLAAQKIWLNAFIAVLNEKRNEVQSQLNARRIQESFEAGLIEDDDGFSQDEIAEAIKLIRERKRRYGSLSYVSIPTP